MDALSIESMIWRFPEIGVLPNHLFLDEIFHEMNIYKPSSYWGTPMTVETIILILRIRKIPGESLRHGPWSHPHRWSRLGRSWAACHGQTGCAMVGAWLKDRQLGRMAQFWILWIRQAVFWKWCSWFLMIGFLCFLFGVGEIREVNTWAIFLLENTWYWVADSGSITTNSRRDVTAMVKGNHSTRTGISAVRELRLPRDVGKIMASIDSWMLSDSRWSKWINGCFHSSEHVLPLYRRIHVCRLMLPLGVHWW